MINDFLIDFYSEKTDEQLSQDKFNNIISTYGDDYDSLINDLYTKYDPGNLNDTKVDLIKTTYDLVDKNPPEDQLNPDFEYAQLIKDKKRAFDKGVFKMAEREAHDKYKLTGEIDLSLLIPEEVLETRKYKYNEIGGDYSVDGVKLSRVQMKDKLYDRDFIDKMKNGEVNVDIKDDERLETLAKRQFESYNEGPLGLFGEDDWQALKSAGISLGASIASAPSFIEDVFAEVTGVENLFGDFEREKRDAFVKALHAKQKEIDSKQREYESDFRNSILKGEFQDAANIGFRTVSESAPIMIASTAAAAATGGTSLVAQSLTSAGVMSALLIPGEYTESVFSEDEKIKDLSRREKLARGFFRGLSEGVFEGVMGPAGGRAFSLFKNGLRSTAKAAAKEGGKEAGQKVAKELADKTALDILKAFGVDSSKEGFTEALTSLSQDLTDDILGVHDLSLSEYLSRASEAGALGLFMGGVVQAGGGTIGKSVDLLTLRNEKIYQGSVTDIRKRQELGTISKEEGDAIIKEIQELDEALKATDSNLNEEEQVQIANLIYQKKRLQEKVKNLDPNQQSVKNDKAEIERINEEISNLSATDADLDLAEKTASVAEKRVKLKIDDTVKFAETQGEKLGKKVYVLETDSEGSAGDKAQKIYQEYLKENPNESEKDVSQADGFYLGDAIVINKDVIGKTGAFNTGQHEVLHGVINNAFNDLNTDQKKKLISDFRNILSDEQNQAVNDRFKAYESDPDFDAETSVEIFTVLSDAIANGDVTFNESFGNKLKNLLQEIFRRVGIVKDFSNARQAYNFLKDYNKTAEKGLISTRAVNLAETAPASQQVTMSRSEITDLAKQYKADPANTNVERLINQYNNVALKALGYDISKGTIAPEEAISFVNKEFNNILRRYDGSTEFSTWVNSNIRPKRQAFYDEQIGKQAETTSIDSEQARQVVDDSETTADDRTEKEIRQAGRKIKVAKRLNLEDKAVKEVSEKVKDVDLSKINYKTLKNLANETIGEAFGISPKKILSNANLTKGEIANAQRYIKNNIDLLKALLPDGYNKDFKSTGVPKVLLDKFYNKRSVRAKTGAGLNVQVKKPNITDKEFLEVFGFVDGKPTRDDRNISARIIALANQTGKAITNQTVREQLQKEGMPESALRDIRSGTPTAMFSITEDLINIRDLFELETKGIDKLLESFNIQKSFNLKTEDGRNAFVESIEKELLPLMPRDFWFGPNSTVFTSSNKTYGLSMSTTDGKNKNENNEYLKPEEAKAYNDLRNKIKSLRNLDDSKFGKPIKIDGKEIDFKIPSYSTMFGSVDKIKKNIKNGSISEWNKKVSTIHREMWKRFNNAINKGGKINKETAATIGTYLKLVGSDTGHWHKLGAQFVGYSDKITGSRFEYEHAMPATAAYLYLMDASLNNGANFNAAYDLVIDNYKLISLDKAMDTKLTAAKLQRKMPDGWSVIDGNWWQRYFNKTVAEQDGGIDPNSIVGLDGKTFSEIFEINSEGDFVNKELQDLKNKSKDANIKELSNNVIEFSKSETNSNIINKTGVIDKALGFARDPNAPVKKIRVFDFDDTLATTKSSVLFTAPDGTEGSLTADKFAMDGARLLQEGYKFDFSEFNKVTKGKPGPLLDIAKKIQAARGTEDVFVLTARAPEAQVAIKEFLDSQGLNIPLKNITGLGNSTGKAKADWMVGKAAEGYNDFYFADDAMQNIKAVKDAMAVLDVKSKVQQAKINFSKSVNEDFNKIIEQTTGIGAEKVYSKAKAKVRGGRKGNRKFFIPYSAEDFMGLIYPLLSKGTLGDSQLAWFKTNLLNPYAKAVENLATDRLQLMQDFKALKKALNVPKDLRKTTESGFTKEQAVRVYLFNQAGHDIPGISQTDLNELLNLVNSDGILKAFGDQIMQITKGDSYVKPGDSWLAGTITTDLIDMLNTVKRAKYLEQSGYTANAELIFSTENLNKLEAAYGTKYREAMESILGRMKSGRNRLFSGNRLSNRVLDYINNSVGTIMFFNTRSAVLQTISSINFLNWSFNNPIKAGAAFANQPQYWKDFKTLMNSDYLLDRRNGLKLNINESEIADAASTAKNKAKAAISYILQKGFLPTQFADSFAIASGGATFYRNRINDLMKNKGMSEANAKEQAMLEWRETAEISQQSSDPSKISSQQSSDLGRIILAFANTPMQYARIQKRALQDLINRRGDAKSHVSKIIYYAVVQNLIFNALQSALFKLGFDEEEDEKKEKMYLKTANGMLDSQLRGLGVAGATVAVIKNFLMDIYERSGRKRPEYVDSVYELLRVSPPVSSKISKIRGAAWEFDSKKRRQEIFEKGFSIDNPAYEAGAKVISATTNVPLDRLYNKAYNIESALTEDVETWQRIAMLAGWPKWQVVSDSNETSTFTNGSVEIKPTESVEYKKLKKLNKSEQIKMLKDLGAGNMAIRKAKKEDDRIKLIIKYNKEQ